MKQAPIDQNTEPFSYLYKGNDRLEKLSKLSTGYIYYNDFRKNILTQEIEDFKFTSFIEELDETSLLTNQENYRLLHLFYESGHYLIPKPTTSSDIKSLNDKQVLAIDLYYEKSEQELIQTKDKENKLKYDVEQVLDESKYRKDFLKGREELIKGECYQFNLTYPKYIKLKEQFDFSMTFKKMVSDKRKAGAFAHGTYLGSENLALVSNSPECLFQAKRKTNGIHLWAMPIKGTISNKNSQTKRNWKILSQSKKDEGELNMITDLLSNELSRINEPIARVVHKKKMLTVPGLIHQFSLIETQLPFSITLGKVIQSLFPGGSITGAPKKNVMKILDNLEKGRERGFYTGSTILLDKKRMVASINIRSGEVDIDKKLMKVSAGGGITLLSDSKEEFKEMEDKRESFLSLFN
jgi:para-aminobenzoate synthetase component I